MLQLVQYPHPVQLEYRKGGVQFHVDHMVDQESYALASGQILSDDPRRPPPRVSVTVQSRQSREREVSRSVRRDLGGIDNGAACAIAMAGWPTCERDVYQCVLFVNGHSHGHRVRSILRNSD